MCFAYYICKRGSGKWNIYVSFSISCTLPIYFHKNHRHNSSCSLINFKQLSERNRMEDLELDKIKDRISKLLRMAEDASSPNEAAIAANRARALMDKHQLSEWEVKDRVEDEFGTSQASRFYSAVPLYLSTFAVQLAKFNDCQVRYEFGPVSHKKKIGEMPIGKCITFMGFKADVELATEMFKSLSDAVNRLCKEYFDEKGDGRKYSVSLGGIFKRAALGEIARRLQAMTIERDALTTSSGTSLVVLKADAVAEKFGLAKYTHKKTREIMNGEEREAAVQGMIRAKSIEIVKSVE